MKRFALGYGCNLNELFVRFHYKRCPNLIKKIKHQHDRLRLIKKVFITGLKVILDDIINNGTTFKLPQNQGLIHFELIDGEQFMRQKRNGKWYGLDFLKTNFSAYQLFLYLKTSKDSSLLTATKKYPVYVTSELRDKIIENVNNGQRYF